MLLYNAAQQRIPIAFSSYERGIEKVPDACAGEPGQHEVSGNGCGGGGYL